MGELIKPGPGTRIARYTPRDVLDGLSGKRDGEARPTVSHRPATIRECPYHGNSLKGGSLMRMDISSPQPGNSGEDAMLEDFASELSGFTSASCLFGRKRACTGLRQCWLQQFTSIKAA
jgi:hypothetical protein